MSQPQTILVTGGAGFIGSNFVNMLLDREPGITIVNLDALTYAGNLDIMTSAALKTAERLAEVQVAEVQVDGSAA